MRIIRCLLVLLFSVICLINEAQVIYSYNDKYRIEIPSKLELQASELNDIVHLNSKTNRSRVKITTRSEHITFQQKGLNDDLEDAYKKYCRVIIEYHKENRNVQTYGRGDHIDIDRDILYTVIETAKESCVKSGTPFIKLISVQPLDINGFPVLYYSYKRNGVEKQSPVIVNVFHIFNRYESVTLIFSYREIEREMWRSIRDKIIKTFCFTKKY